MTDAADALLEFIDRSPTPWHAAASVATRLEAAGFVRLDEGERWSLKPGDAAYVIRGDSSVIAFRVGSAPLTESGFRIIGAHTDSPGLRLKPRAASAKGNLLNLNSEVYGGPILATFADRDLTLAGRLMVANRGRTESRLFAWSEPLCRIPNLAIHMNRTVNEEGLKLDPVEQLPALMGYLGAELGPEERLRRWLCDAAGVREADLRSWELALVDTQPGARYGIEREFIANGQLDNLTSSHAAVAALCEVEAPEHTAVAALFDHEEVGSLSHKGAEGGFLADVVARVAHAAGSDDDDRRRALARSWLLSADTAHAYHPAYPAHHDEENQVQANAGPAIKINAKQRYATDAEGEAFFQAVCETAGVPWQRYVHRANLPCGSTIGPISAARLGVRTIDIGSPIWAMHSIRESGGARDQDYLQRAMATYFSLPAGL